LRIADAGDVPVEERGRTVAETEDVAADVLRPMFLAQPGRGGLVDGLFHEHRSPSRKVATTRV